MKPLAEAGMQANKKVMGVYRIVNKVDGKIYVGSSKDCCERFYRHAYRSTKIEQKSPLYRAIRDCGIENFVCEILQTVDDYRKLPIVEKMYIMKYRSNEEAYGYNVGPAETGHWNISEEARAHISEGVKRNWEERRKEHSENEAC